MLGRTVMHILVLSPYHEYVVVYTLAECHYNIIIPEMDVDLDNLYCMLRCYSESNRCLHL